MYGQIQWSVTLLNKLQVVQYFACRIVSGARKYDHITPIPKELSWLSVANQLYYRGAIDHFQKWRLF